VLYTPTTRPHLTINLPTKSSTMPVTPEASTQGTWRKEIEATLETVKQLISKSASPISSTPYAPSNEPDAKQMTGLLTDLRKLGFQDVETLLSLFNSQAKGVQDDNKFILEHLVQLLAKLDDNSKVANQLTGGFINGLWNALPHPPLTGLGTKYQYREPDGSNNNIRFPDLGKAKTPYARSAKPTVLQNIALPDPGAIFDSLMERGDEFEPHPNKISSMLFYLATIIIHDAFRTVCCPGVFDNAGLIMYRITRISISQTPAATWTWHLCTEALRKSKRICEHSRTEN
jgi:hypothetical protein